MSRGHSVGTIAKSVGKKNDGALASRNERRDVLLFSLIVDVVLLEYDGKTFRAPYVFVQRTYRRETETNYAVLGIYTRFKLNLRKKYRGGIVTVNSR